MHLSIADYRKHIDYVSSILRQDGYYIFATLNPKYECLKASRLLENGEKYDFAHGKTGEYGTFYHYYKTNKEYDYSLKDFELVKKILCTPITDTFTSTHSRYYNSEVPMAFIYVLRKK